MTPPWHASNIYAVAGSDMEEDGDRKSRPVKRWADTLRFSTLGLRLGLSVVIGAVGGYWLDGRFDTEPWLTGAGVVLGAAAGFVQLARELQRMDRGDE